MSSKKSSTNSETPNSTKSPSASSVLSKETGIAALGGSAEFSFDDADWNLDQEKMNSLEALGLTVVKKTVSQEDLVSLIALKKTLHRYAASLNEDYLTAFDEVYVKQKSLKGKLLSKMKGYVSAKDKGVDVMSMQYPNPLLESQYTVDKYFEMLKESKLYTNFDFDTLEGDLTKIDTVDIDDVDDEEQSMSNVEIGHVKANKKGKKSKLIAPIAVSDVPTLATMGQKSFIAFLNSVKNLKAKGFDTDVRLQILNDVCKQTLYYEMILVDLISTEDEFENILDDLSSFITMGENLVKKWDIPQGGELSDMNLIRNKLDVDFSLREKDSFNKAVIPMFSQFQTQHDDIMNDVSMVNQKKYVETFIGMNVKDKKNQVKEIVFALFPDACGHKMLVSPAF